MSSHGSPTSASQPNPGASLQSPVVQPWEPHGSPTTYEGLTVPDIQAFSTPTPIPGARGWSKRIRNRAAGPHLSLTRLNLIGPCEFISSRIAQPKCASTAELFGHLPGYLQHAHPPPQEEDDNYDDDDDDGTFTQEVLSPLKKRQRKKIRESAGVKPKPPTKRTIGPSIPKPTSLPPVGRARCLWGRDCTVQMAFDYTQDTIRDWKNHIASHLVKSNTPTEDPAGRHQKSVKCRWGGCSEKVERGYLFKHIVTHEVRFKLLCPRGCGVAFRDDNLERHLRSCRLSDQ